jgi:hypothetical protein
MISGGDKIHHLIDLLKPKIRLKVAVDPLNDAISIGLGGPIKNQKKSTMKFTNGRKIDYKRVEALLL